MPPPHFVIPPQGQGQVHPVSPPQGGGLIPKAGTLGVSQALRRGVSLLRIGRGAREEPANSRSVVLFVKLRILHFVLEVKSL